MRSVETRALALHGLRTQVMHIEVATVPDAGTFHLAALAEASARESRVRVRAALQQLGVDMNQCGISVRVGPEEHAKGGTFDVAIALAVLGALGELSPEALKDTVLLGELSLTGAIRPVRGVLPALYGAASLGITCAIVPEANAREAANVPGVTVLVAHHLAELARHLKTGAPLDGPGNPPVFRRAPAPGSADLADVRGQYGARRALEITAAGGHNLLMIGPPGSGKTMLARRLPTILPPLSRDEALEITAIHSVAGLLPPEQGLLASRPFRAPHHTVSGPGLVGGGEPVRPGEVSLAHHGCLFLDELLEFRRPVLDALRMPLEDGQATICRARARVTFPARPLLVAAVNPCPCGFAGERSRRCTCSPERRQRYRDRLNGACSERFDVQVALPPVDVLQLQSSARAESSIDVQKRVIAARAAQAERARGGAQAQLNAQRSPRDLERFAASDAAGARLLMQATERLGLSAAAYGRVLRVARTIADLDASEVVHAPHVAEALNATVLPIARHEAASS